jgi:hypothetical protein
MTDFEERLVSSLRSAGADAPDAAGLAPAARVRARSRRRRTALASAVGVVAVAAVVGGVALLGSGGDDGSTTVADDVSTPAPTTRVETWHDVSVTVPSNWGHGSMSTWCIQGAEPGTPVVERPGGVVESIACTPANGYGVRFADVPDEGFEAFGPGTVNASVGGDFPAGSWQGWDAAGGSRVLVVAPTQAEAEQVLGSFASLGDDDPDGNGCLPRLSDRQVAVPGGQVRLCRYDVRGRLEQSEVLTGQDASDAVTALEAAPAEEMHSCSMSANLTRVEVTSGEAFGSVELSDTCPGFGWDDEWHPLTGDVLHWVLSPGWSGQVPEGIRFQPRS